MTILSSSVGPDSDRVRLDSIADAIAAIADGQPVVVVDDYDRENEGDLIFAAQAATPELMAFTIRHSSGVICVPMPAERLTALHLPPMTTNNADPFRTAFSVSVDARDGVSTGISAADRAHTAALLADPKTRPSDLVRPGHIFPLSARPHGVLERRGHTEAAVDLARLAGCEPVGVLVELVNDDGTMKRAPELRAFADEHGLVMISIEDLAIHLIRTTSTVQRMASAALPTDVGEFRAVAYRSRIDGQEHIALVHGEVAGHHDVPVRVHSECLTGDAFGSTRCDCGPQLHRAMEAIVEAGRGVVVYVRGHEGRGIGLVSKLQAYELQDGGLDTVDANVALGHPIDARRYDTAAQILRDLEISSLHLLTNNPDKVISLQNAGAVVTERVPVIAGLRPENARYLSAKRERLGHLI